MAQNTDELTCINDYLSNIQNELNRFCTVDQSETLTQVMDLILERENKGGRLHFTGIGKSSHVAAYIASLFSSTGTPAYHLDATEAIHGSSGQVKPQDIVFCISNSGETQELKETIKTLIRNGTTLVSLTGNPNSWIAKNTAIALFAQVENEGGPLNRAPRTSVIMQIILLQTLSVLLQKKKNIPLEQFVKWHPGGKLGQM